MCCMYKINNKFKILGNNVKYVMINFANSDYILKGYNLGIIVKI